MVRTALDWAMAVDWPCVFYHADEVLEGYVLSGCAPAMHGIEKRQSHHLSFIGNVLFYYIKCSICNVAGWSWQSAAAHYVALGFVSSLFFSPSISFICPHAMFPLSLSFSLSAFNWRTRSLSHSVKLCFRKMDPFPYIHDTQGSMTTPTQHPDPWLTYIRSLIHIRVRCAHTQIKTTHSPFCPRDILLVFAVWWRSTDLTVLLPELWCDTMQHFCAVFIFKVSQYYTYTHIWSCNT